MTLGKALEIEADAAQRSSYWLVLSKQRSTDLVNGELCLGFEMMYMDQQQHSQVRVVLPAQHVVNVCVCASATIPGRLPSRWPVLPYPAQLRELDRLWHVAVDSRLATSAPPQASWRWLTLVYLLEEAAELDLPATAAAPAESKTPLHCLD